MERLEGFAPASAAVAERGWPVLLRDTGGEPVPQSPGVLNIALSYALGPGDNEQTRIETAYLRLCQPICDWLRERGLDAGVGAVAGSFCDGRYNVTLDGRKLAGTAQRWRRCAPPARRRARCRDEWWCSGFPRCRRRPSRRWPPWPGSARCCSACTTPVATTGPTSSPTRTCCATSTAASSAAPASPPTSTRTASTSMPSRCWRPGASRAATTSTCSTATTTRTAIGTCSARSTAGASTCSARRPRTGCSASCRTISSNCAHWRKPASTGRRWRRGATPRSASMWPTARSAKWRSSTTSCSPASTPIRA
ncbi:hypothetical protein K652_06408 [Pseudomonas aeruginosa VRFPA02]|nr:hypothetical protein K652_06408 [Pseudomonas aeruginosa VRFPA02]